jgi:hypothetical protein
MRTSFKGKNQLLSGYDFVKVYTLYAQPVVARKFSISFAIVPSQPSLACGRSGCRDAGSSPFNPGLTLLRKVAMAIRLPNT